MIESNRRWRRRLLVVIAVLVVLAAGRMALRYVDWQMTGAHVSKDAPGAKRFAERFGLRLADGDHVVYGEVQSSFPDSGAYLVVDVPSIADRERLMEQSGLRCAPADPATLGQRRGVDDHGPGTAPALQDCSGSHRYNGGLTASFDPVDHHLGTRIYIGAYEM